MNQSANRPSGLLQLPPLPSSSALKIPFNQSPNPVLVLGSYVLIERIGSGSFGEIWRGYKIHTSYQSNQSNNPSKYVALKLEPMDMKYKQLAFEYRLYQLLHAPSNNQQHYPHQSSPQSTSHADIGAPGIPHVYEFGSHYPYTVLVMEELGPSLEQLFNQANRKFSLRTICLIAIQSIKRIQFLHEKSFLHRDIKPDNLLVGKMYQLNTSANHPSDHHQNRQSNNHSNYLPNFNYDSSGYHAPTHNHSINQSINQSNDRSHEQPLYLIDYGLAKKYRDLRTLAHFPFADHKDLTGTIRYASIHSHLGVEASRRDDLESLTYVLIYLFKGSLPWQGLQCAHRKEKFHAISAKKLNTPIGELCSGMPSEFSYLLNYARTLGYAAEPEYERFINLFRALMRSRGWDDQDYSQFDWLRRARGEHVDLNEGLSLPDPVMSSMYMPTPHDNYSHQQHHHHHDHQHEQQNCGVNQPGYHTHPQQLVSTTPPLMNGHMHVPSPFHSMNPAGSISSHQPILNSPAHMSQVQSTLPSHLPLRPRSAHSSDHYDHPPHHHSTPYSYRTDAPLNRAVHSPHLSPHSPHGNGA